MYPVRHPTKGESTQNVRNPKARFIVKVHKYNEDTEMIVGPKNIYVLSVLTGMDDQGSGEMAVTSVTQTMRDLCNQLQQKMREFVDEYSKNQGTGSKAKASGVKPEAAMSRAIRAVFEQFDVDGNGVLDAKEMLVACQQLNLKITEEQVNLIWPMLDVDGMSRMK